MSNAPTPIDYINAGLALCIIPKGEKGPGSDDWQLEANAIKKIRAAMDA